MKKLLFKLLFRKIGESKIIKVNKGIIEDTEGAKIYIDIVLRDKPIPPAKI